MTVVTISAAYGAGGSAIGPMVAEELGVPFLDRAIPVAVAERLDVSEREACERDESVGCWMSRAVLAEHPTALHVRLTGPLDARIEQAMALGEADRGTAERLAEQADRAREAYVRHFYRADARHAEHYHLVLDSTALPLPACTDLIVAAAQARQQARG